MRDEGVGREVDAGRRRGEMRDEGEGRGVDVGQRERDEG
jgi:hypothetical protein